MKEYLRLFLNLIFVIFVLNVAQAEVSEDMTQVKAPHVAQAEVSEDMTQVKAPHVAQAEVSEDMTQVKLLV